MYARAQCAFWDPAEAQSGCLIPWNKLELSYET